MANTSKRRHESTDVTKRPKNPKARDLLAKADRPDAAKGGAGVARDSAHPTVYQHNQTDLEFLR